MLSESQPQRNSVTGQVTAALSATDTTTANFSRFWESALAALALAYIQIQLHATTCLLCLLPQVLVPVTTGRAQVCPRCRT